MQILSQKLDYLMRLYFQDIPDSGGSLKDLRGESEASNKPHPYLTNNMDSCCCCTSALLDNSRKVIIPRKAFPAAESNVTHASCTKTRLGMGK